MESSNYPINEDGHAFASKSKTVTYLVGWDFAVLIGYFIIVLATGFYSMFRSNRGTISGYFLAGRFMYWLPVGASVFASNIGSEHFIGLSGSGAAAGIGVGAFELNALLILQLCGWIFLPVFIASRVCTLPEYMSKRFGGNRIRLYLALLSLLLYVFTKISVNLYSGGIFIQLSLGWSLYVSVIILLIMTALCTVTGGLKAVIYTDTFQCFVMIIGAGIVAIKAFIEIGGYSQLREKYMQSYPSVIPPNLTQCAAPKEHSFQMLRSADDPDMPWAGFLFGQTPASIWLLAAKSLSHAQGGTLFAGLLKIFPLFIIIMPGMISRVLYTDEVACVDPKKCMEYCNNEVSCSNISYPKLVMELMPNGLKGLMLAVMLAALMSDLTSIFNSASTLFTCDIWPRIRKDPTIKELMIVGRSFVIVMIVISILWIPIIQQMQGGQLYIYIQAIAAYLSPPIAAAYIMAVLWPRLNERGAFWSLMIGFVIGVFRMVLDFIYREVSCGQIDERPLIIKRLHYMYFAIILFWITVISAIIISLITDPPEDFRLIRTTFWTRFDNRDRDDDKDNLELKRREEIKDKPTNVNGTAIHIKDAEKIITDERETREPMVKRFYVWFCGVEDTPEDAIQEEQFYDRLESIASLQQTPKEKTILTISLVIVVSIAISLYTYFSIP